MQILRSTVSMGTAKDTEMQLQMVVGSRGVGAMHFGSSKKVPVATFVSAEKFGVREGGTNFANTFHVEGTF